MASQNERMRNNVKAGLFVSISIIAAFLVIVTLGGGFKLFERSRPYAIRFSVASGVKGLARGSVVSIGGLAQGRVLDIEPEMSQGAVTGMLVHIELPETLTIYSNAVALRMNALLGDSASINFPDIGNATHGTPLAANDVLDATDAPGLLASLLGPGNAARAGNIVRNVDEMVSTLRGDYDSSVSPALKRFDTITADVGAVTAAVRADYPGWSERVTSILDKANQIPDSLERTLADGRQLIADARSMIQDNRPSVDEIVENVRLASGDVRAITERARGEIMDKLDALFARGQEGIDAFTRTVRRIEDLVVAQTPVIENMLADAGLTAQQLKLTSVEVRRSPWKLLYTPSTKELEHELLYDAARSFAIAASELKSSSQSLERLLLEHPGAVSQDPDMVERLRRSLQGSLERYDSAQDALFNIIVAEPVTR